MLMPTSTRIWLTSECIYRSICFNFYILLCHFLAQIIDSRRWMVYCGGKILVAVDYFFIFSSLFMQLCHLFLLMNLWMCLGGTNTLMILTVNRWMRRRQMIVDRFPIHFKCFFYLLLWSYIISLYKHCLNLGSNPWICWASYLLYMWMQCIM